MKLTQTITRNLLILTCAILLSGCGGGGGGGQRDIPPEQQFGENPNQEMAMIPPQQNMGMGPAGQNMAMVPPGLVNPNGNAPAATRADTPIIPGNNQNLTAGNDDTNVTQDESGQTDGAIAPELNENNPDFKPEDGARNQTQVVEDLMNNEVSGFDNPRVENIFELTPRDTAINPEKLKTEETENAFPTIIKEGSSNT